MIVHLTQGQLISENTEFPSLESKRKGNKGGKLYPYGSLTFSKLLCKLQSSDNTFPTGGAACCAHQVEKRRAVWLELD